MYRICVSLLALKDPVEMAIARFEVLVVELGTVAKNVHWIRFPLTLPFTELTLCWREKTQITRKTMSFHHPHPFLTFFFLFFPYH